MSIQILEKVKYDPLNENITLPNHTDKIILPEEILNNLIKLQKENSFTSLPHPLVFRLSTPSNYTYVGVREFHSIDNESVFLSKDVKERLRLNKEELAQLSVELAYNVIDIGKASIELEPILNYSIRDWKVFLESTLSKNYTAVTTGDVITFEVGEMEYKLKVNNVKTFNQIRTVCVIDRDIDLNIQIPQNSEVKEDKNLQIGEYRDLFNDKNGTIDIHERCKLNIGVGMKFVSINNIDFTISYDQFVDGERFLMGSMNKPIKEWINETDDDVAVYIYAIIGPIDFQIVIAEDIVEETVPEDSMRCNYCNNIIKKQSQILHENFCKRNNVLCSLGCNRVFLKEIPKTHWHCCSTYGDDEQSYKVHQEYIHDLSMSDYICDECEKYNAINKYVICEHKNNECYKSLHECRYCHLILPRGKPSNESIFYGISEHEWQCGSKTTECFKCNKIIKLRDLETHLKLHEIMKLQQSTPLKCKNELCVEIISNNVENSLQLCDICFGSLYSNILDPDGKKLLQRIERRYILQIKNGCGDEKCENEYCQSSKKCLLKGSNMVEIVKFVKNNIIPEVINEKKFKFCVSNKMNQHRRYVEYFIGGEYEEGWVCKSNKECGDDIEKMSGWLDKYAVKTNK
ncbi:hypothetical protein DAPK24_003620 [Pichia kluyveri]|uniref:Ubiquitin-protein ligase E3A N-terminal zinc-binding domain-containing protein n=1 Tax=Pichia kluyveri TaxID=36015 RepID=A0AAV5QXR6_PICKL|nr:hypothetical protein DAPK24_003620 [Pichia kluyveri]